MLVSSPFPTFLSATLPSTFGYFSSGWPVAYLVATVIFAIGALVGSLVHVSQPAQVAEQSASLPSPLSPLPSVVGRITDMVDCKWEKGSRGRGLGTGTENRKSEIGNLKSRLPSATSLPFLPACWKSATTPEPR